MLRRQKHFRRNHGYGRDRHHRIRSEDRNRKREYAAALPESKSGQRSGPRLRMENHRYIERKRNDFFQTERGKRPGAGNHPGPQPETLFAGIHGDQQAHRRTVHAALQRLRYQPDGRRRAGRRHQGRGDIGYFAGAEQNMFRPVTPGIPNTSATPTPLRTDRKWKASCGSWSTAPSAIPPRHST